MKQSGLQNSVTPLFDTQIALSFLLAMTFFHIQYFLFLQFRFLLRSIFRIFYQFLYIIQLGNINTTAMRA